MSGNKHIHLKTEEKDGKWRVFSPAACRYMASVVGWTSWSDEDHSEVAGYDSEEIAKEAAEDRSSFEIIWK